MGYGFNDAKYRYDALGRRILRYAGWNDSSVQERYFYDGADVICDYDMKTGKLKALYLTPFLDENLLMEDFTGPGPVLAWYMQDGLGSVRQLVVGKRVTNSYAYTAWGVPLNWRERVSNRYTYTSREYNAESGDYYYRARHYTPTLGRFTTRDPVEKINLYIYVLNHPVNIADSTGKEGDDLLEYEDILTFEAINQGVARYDDFWSKDFKMYFLNVHYRIKFVVKFKPQHDQNPDCYGFYQEFKIRERIELDEKKTALPWFFDVKIGETYTDWGTQVTHRTNQKTGEYPSTKGEREAKTADHPTIPLSARREKPRGPWKGSYQHTEFIMYLVRRNPKTGELGEKVAYVKWGIEAALYRGPVEWQTGAIKRADIYSISPHLPGDLKKVDLKKYPNHPKW